jgi:hypothetical protein
MAEAARRDQNPSPAPPALSQSFCVAWSRGGERREKRSDLREEDSFIAVGWPTAPSGYQNPPLIQRWIRLELDGSTVLETPRDKISCLGKG